ncbi:hypothetical protein DUI87_20365 [Hirundo rustica rustica]|uniref:Uncharacterized protein n=1 Tax=Hirundo rustica rustica TaxID=333673 RepID=A0A3M0JSG7_HIRRU|nr:hypothetical protein DUI87_20365 [Hirundo rustica rustica]
MTLSLRGVGMPVYPQVLVYAGYLQSVFILTCDHKGKIQPIGKLETVTKMKVIKWMNYRVMTQMQTMQVASQGINPRIRTGSQPFPLWRRAREMETEWGRCFADSPYLNMGPVNKATVAVIQFAIQINKSSVLFVLYIEFCAFKTGSKSEEKCGVCFENPDEVGKYLEENCHDDSKEKNIAITWAQAYVYHTLLDTVGQQIEAEEQGDKSDTQAAANPTATQVAAKPDSEAKTSAVATVKKGKKHTRKTN